MEVLVLFRRKAPSHCNIEKLPFPGEGFHIENRRLGSLFEDRRIRQKKNPKKRNPKKTPKKTQKKNQKKTWKKTHTHIQYRHICACIGYLMRAQSRCRHTFSVSQVCASIGYLLYSLLAHQIIGISKSHFVPKTSYDVKNMLTLV